MLHGGTTVEQVVKKVLDEYEVDEDRARSYVERIVEKLREADAIED